MTDYELVDLLFDQYYLNINNYILPPAPAHTGDIDEYFRARLPEDERNFDIDLADEDSDTPSPSRGVDWIFAPEDLKSKCTSGEVDPETGDPICIGSVLIPFIYPNSPADAAGLQRGDVVMGIDEGDPSATPLTDFKSFVLLPPGTNFEEIDSSGRWLENFFFLNMTSVTFLVESRVDGIQRRVAVGPPALHEPYSIDSRVVQLDGANVGYLLINKPTLEVERELISAIQTFQARTVSELIIDLRYAAEGSIDLLSELAYMIAEPARAEDVYFSRQLFNQSRFQNCPVDPVTGDDPPAIPFYKVPRNAGLLPDGEELPQLNLSRVVVITNTDRHLYDSYTCGAAELFIASLKGIDFPTTVVGDGPTCGNPYGGYPIEIGGFSFLLDMYTNTHEDGSTVAGGIMPDCLVDDTEKAALPLMDTNETLFDAALDYLQSNQCPPPLMQP